MLRPLTREQRSHWPQGRSLRSSVADDDAGRAPAVSAYAVPTDLPIPVNLSIDLLHDGSSFTTRAQVMVRQPHSGAGATRHSNTHTTASHVPLTTPACSSLTLRVLWRGRSDGMRSSSGALPHRRGSNGKREQHRTGSRPAWQADRARDGWMDTAGANAAKVCTWVYMSVYE